MFESFVARCTCEIPTMIDLYKQIRKSTIMGKADFRERELGNFVISKFVIRLDWFDTPP